MSGRLDTLATQLEAQGISAGNLHELQEELDHIQSPPGLFRRLSDRARRVAGQQWRHVVGELQESLEAAGLVRGRLLAGQDLSAADRDKVRAQMLDLMRVVPAGLIAAANAALPVPGTSAVTPWLLVRLGLMPSRWRESHVLDGMRKEASRLRASGHHIEAQRIETLQHDLEMEADARERAAHDAALLTHWDSNQNGIWDDDEVAAYQATHAELCTLRASSAMQRRWFLSHGLQVFGPVRLGDLQASDVDIPLLVCFDGRTGWVCLDDLFEASVDPERFA